MLSETQAKAKGLADLPPVTSDSLLALIAMANADPRADKIDVGVGVFRDAAGETPILKVMKRPSGSCSRRSRPRPISEAPATSVSPS
jgi:aspartate/tyrosine/aromatic aminotransferase